MKGKGVLGVVTNPTTGETYHAVRGQGAFKNGDRLRVSGCAALGAAFVTVSFSADEAVISQAKPVWDALLTRAQTLRRMGSTALELALLAEGKTDAFVGFGQGPWDVAAGVVLVEEAGVEPSSFSTMARPSSRRLRASCWGGSRR